MWSVECVQCMTFYLMDNCYRQHGRGQVLCTSQQSLSHRCHTSASSPVARFIYYKSTTSGALRFFVIPLKGLPPTPLEWHSCFKNTIFNGISLADWLSIPFPPLQKLMVDTSKSFQQIGWPSSSLVKSPSICCWQMQHLILWTLQPTTMFGFESSISKVGGCDKPPKSKFQIWTNRIV